MKKLVFILMIVFSSSLSFSQEVLYEDSFDTKEENWVSTDDYVEEFKNGELILHGYLRKETVLVMREIRIDPGKDFSIKCSIKYADGHTKKPFGLMALDTRYTDKMGIYKFKIYPKDGYAIDHQVQYRYKPVEVLPKTTKTGIVKGPGEYNLLELRNTNGVVEFFINDHKVWSSSDFDFCISIVGFMNEGYQNVKVDYFVAKQEGWQNINLVEESGKIFLKENLGENVNSKAEELAPIISADGQTLYLTVESDKNNIGKEDTQDIWYSTLNPDSTWSRRVNIKKPLNNESNNSVVYCSPDNNSLVVINRYDKSGKSIGAGLSKSERTKGGWTIPTALNIKNYYNDNLYCSSNLSPSQNEMILSLERKDSYGEKDFYISFRQDDDSWSEPLNMGSDINTFGDEGTPFIAADNVTLYFSSNAYPGYGSHDIYITRRLDETWTKWSKPQNLGPSINTPGWDAYFTIPASGDYSYLVSTDNSFGNEDIFRIKVSEAAKPNPVALITGKVFNLKSSTFIEARITYSDLETNEEIGIASSNPENGAYTISLPAGHKYSFHAQKEGYYPVSENIDLTGLDDYAEITKDLFLSQMEVGDTVRLNNIFFEYDKSELLETSVYELERLFSIMNENPQIVIQIAGHTDNMGTDAYNQKLSEARAQAVYNYLKNKSIAATRISYIGYGESIPVETNDTEEGRAFNRRVEFVIVSK